ncbi:hypothetical protein JCM3765_004652 [Sporobolomyces pararoseus]
MKFSLSQAYETLEVEQGSSIETVRSAYKKLSIRHHPNIGSPDATAKFQEVSGAYERILKHFEDPKPRMNFGGGGFGPFNGDSDDYDEEGDWSEGESDSEDEAHAAHEYFYWVFEEILRGGYGSHASYKHRKAHPNDQETPEEHAQRVRQEAEMLKKAQAKREAEEKRAREAAQQAREKETELATARRQEKKAAAVASKSAARIEAAELAQKRLALLQHKRSTVFTAARSFDIKTVKHGIYELNVDPNGGEFLPGGKAALEEYKSAGIDIHELENELSGNSGGKKKKKGKQPESTSSPSSSIPTPLDSAKIPGSFPPTPASSTKASPVVAQTSGLFEGAPPSSSKGSKNKKKKNKNKQKSATSASQTPLSVDTPPSTPPPEPAWKSTTEPGISGSTSTPDALFDPLETLLHIASNHNQKELYVWLLDHGAVPEERNSGGFTAFHLALLLNHTELVEHSLADLKPTFPPLSYAASCDSPDPYYPLPKNQTLLSLALIGGSKNPVKVLELVRIILPFIGGREIHKGWKKAEFEQGRKGLRDWKWDAWEEIKWIMAERMQELNFDGFLVPEEYQGRRPRAY